MYVIYVQLYMCRPVYVYEYECSCMFICTIMMCLYELFEYVQCCEDTVGVKLCYIYKLLLLLLLLLIIITVTITSLSSSSLSLLSLLSP